MSNLTSEDAPGNEDKGLFCILIWSFTYAARGHFWSGYGPLTMSLEVIYYSNLTDFDY